MITNRKGLCWVLAFAILVVLGLPQPAAAQVAGDEHWDDRFVFAGVDGQITTVAVGPDGDVYVGGNFTKAGGEAAQHIAHWDGRRWHALGEGLNGWAHQILVVGDRVYVSGDFTTAGGVDAAGIAQWDGANWAPLGSGVGPVDDYFGSLEQGDIYALVASGNTLFVGGDFTSIDGVAANNVAQWDGTTWSALGRGMGGLDWEGNFSHEGEVRTLLVDGDTLYAGGDFELAGEVTANSIAAWDGQAWSSLATGVTLRDDNGDDLKGRVMALAMDQNVLYAGGWFDRAGGQTAANIAAWNGAAWSALGAGIRAREFASEPPIYALAISGGKLFAGGDFTGAGGQSLELLAQWDGATWSLVGDGVSEDDYDVVKALAAIGDGGVDGIYAGGTFRVAGNQRVNNIAHWNGTAWSGLGQGLAYGEYGDDPGRPYAIVVDAEGRVYAGGEFAIAGGERVGNLAMWDGERWQGAPFGPGSVNGRVRALAVGGDTLYVAGEFTQAGGVSANHIAAWNRTNGTWSALGSGINGDVYALAYVDGLLYAGGGFTAAGNATAADVAIWDGAEWHPFGAEARIYERSEEGGEIGTYVNALAVAGDLVFVAGHFQTIHYGFDTSDLNSFEVVHNVVAWNRQTDTWSWLGTLSQRGVTNQGHSGFSIDANTMAIVGESLFVGGTFNQAGGLAAANIARWDMAAGVWSALGDSVGGIEDSEVNALAAYGANLLVGGKFTAVGNTPANFIARYDTTTGQWSPLGGGVKWYNDRFTAVESVAAAPSGVFIGGAFDRAGGKPASGFARWGEPLGGGNVTPEAGGTVNGADGINIVFPGGSVAEDATVTLTRLSAAPRPLPEGLKSVHNFRGTAQTLAGQPITTFAQPYTLRAPYTDEMLAAAGITNPATLNIVFWSGNAWTPMLPCAGCSVDTVNRIITVVANHFTDFALVGAGASTVPQENALFLPLVLR